MAWTRVQHKANATGASGQTRAVTITASKSGSMFVVFVMSNDGTAARTVSTVTDNAGSVYAKLVQTNDANRNSSEMWYALTPTPGVTTVTVTMNASASVFLDAYVVEYTPPFGTVPSKEAVTNGNTGSTSSATPGSITTVGTDGLVVVCALCDTPTAVNGSFNIVDTTDGNGVIDRLDTPVEAYNPTITVTAATWVCNIGAFKTTNHSAGPATKLRPAPFKPGIAR